MSVATITPRVQMPFSLLPTGRATYCDQASPADVQSQVLNVVSCPVGSNPYSSTFGVPPMVGELVPLDLAGLVNAVQTQVPELQDASAEQAYTVVGAAVQIALTGDVQD